MNDLFLRVLNMSVTGCYVILAVLAARFLLRKAPKKYSYALWAAAGFRLVCPVSFRSVLSLFSLRPFQSVSQTGSGMTFIPKPAVYEPAPTVNSAADAVELTVSGTLPTVTPSIAPSVTPSVTSAATADPIQILLLVGTALWLLGMAVMAAVSIVNYIRLKKELQFAIRLEGNIWQSEAVRSPFILGVWKPKIYIPYGLDDQTRETILAHEQYHLKRFDHWVKVFAFGALTLHWFNPLCHLAFRLMSRDMEMSCDEHVLVAKSIETTAYSQSLLTIATNRRFPAATPLAFAETGVKERMINVLKWRKPRTWVTVTAIVLSALMLISCVANPKLSEPKVDDVTLLEFPGVKWNSSIEEVKDILNLKEEQILLDEMNQDEGVEYENWYLVVSDIQFFGLKAEWARFIFVRYPGNEYGLMNIQLEFPEGTDANTLKSAMQEVYGEGCDAPIQSYHFNEQGELIADDMDSMVTPAYAAQGFPYYWYSTEKGTEVLSAEAQERHVAHYTGSNSKYNPGLNREGLLEYLEKTPLVRVSCMDWSNSDTCRVTFYANHLVHFVQQFGE